MHKTKIFLHGHLGKRFGREYEFAVQTPKDAYNALRVNIKGFDRFIVNAGMNGMDYQVVVDDKCVEDAAEFVNIKIDREMHIVPCVIAGGPVAFVWGLISSSTFLTSLLTSLIVSAVLYGLQLLLFPPPKPPPITQQVSAGANSYFFGGRANIAGQGQVVPVGYGRLKIGSQIVHASIRSVDLGNVADGDVFSITIT